MRRAEITYRITDWKKFQHYRDRRPPWIKLHRELLDDSRYMRLSLSSRGLLHGLSLLASEAEDGLICGGLVYIARRLHVDEVKRRDLDLLVSHGFLEESASKPLALRKQLATPETETETETEAEGEKRQRSEGERGTGGEREPVAEKSDPGSELLPGESPGAPGALSRPEETGAEPLGAGAPVESPLGDGPDPGGGTASMEGTGARPEPEGRLSAEEIRLKYLPEAR